MSEQLISWLASCSNDPYAWVLGAFPWEEPNTRLENISGPEGWQIKILCDLREGLITTQHAIQEAVASGHGVGKTALVSWIILWAASTLPDTRGVVTANTEKQLKTKTWAELGKWYNLLLPQIRDKFDLTATALISRAPGHELTWRIDMIPWSEKNTEAFAGLHNKDRRVLVIFDEGSAIVDKIYETIEGALTDADTQIIWVVFGNPTRSTGRFRESFKGGRFAKYWRTYQVDSRTISFTNKDQIQRWIDAYGEDSDFVRIRVRGEFPRTGEMEFISAALVDESRSREAFSQPHDPLIIGVDVARYGANESVIAFRKGRDARSIPWRFFRGLDTVALAAQVAQAATEFHADAIFVDGGGVGGGVVDNLRNLNISCFEINFGSKPDNVTFEQGIEGESYANKRAEMWGMTRAWLKGGAIPDDPELGSQLIGPTYTINLNDDILLEKKEDMMRRGVESPDRADALVLTFALPVAKSTSAGGEGPRKPLIQSEYNPFAPEHMEAA